jgi:hypothetical protein
MKWLAVFLAAAVLALGVPARTSAGGNLPQYQPFVGSWYFHSGPDMTVNAEGTAVSTWRTIFCNVPGIDPNRPCDRVDDTGTIWRGGVAKILLTDAEGPVANGIVQSSTDPNGFFRAGDHVQFELLTDGRMLITNGRNFELPICGPNTDPALGLAPCGA